MDATSRSYRRLYFRNEPNGWLSNLRSGDKCCNDVFGQVVNTNYFKYTSMRASTFSNFLLLQSSFHGGLNERNDGRNCTFDAVKTCPSGRDWQTIFTNCRPWVVHPTRNNSRLCDRVWLNGPNFLWLGHHLVCNSDHPTTNYLHVRIHAIYCIDSFFIVWKFICNDFYFRWFICNKKGHEQEAIGQEGNNRLGHKVSKNGKFGESGA